MEHNEFVVELADYTREWIDPVVELTETDDEIIVHSGAHEYRYAKSVVKRWVVRPYSQLTTDNPI